MSGTTTEAAPSPVASDLIGSGVEGGLGDQIRAWWQRVRGGDMGALPAVGGLIVLSLLFTVLSPFFLTERNFANLLNQAAPLVVLGMAWFSSCCSARSTSPPVSRAASAWHCSSCSTRSSASPGHSPCSSASASGSSPVRS